MMAFEFESATPGGPRMPSRYSAATQEHEAPDPLVDRLRESAKRAGQRSPVYMQPRYTPTELPMSVELCWYGRNSMIFSKSIRVWGSVQIASLHVRSRRIKKSITTTTGRVPKIAKHNPPLTHPKYRWVKVLDVIQPAPESHIRALVARPRVIASIYVPALRRNARLNVVAANGAPT